MVVTLFKNGSFFVLNLFSLLLMLTIVFFLQFRLEDLPRPSRMQSGQIRCSENLLVSSCHWCLRLHSNFGRLNFGHFVLDTAIYLIILNKILQTKISATLLKFVPKVNLCQRILKWTETIAPSRFYRFTNEEMTHSTNHIKPLRVPTRVCCTKYVN